MIMNKKVTLEDIDKLNYAQINRISDKLGETQFNPNDYFDSEDDDEVFNKYRQPQNHPDHDEFTKAQKAGELERLETEPISNNNMVIQKDNFSYKSNV